MTPVAGGITHGKENWFVFPARLGKCLLAPGIPVDGIVRVLEKIRRLLMNEAIRVLWRATLDLGIASQRSLAFALRGGQRASTYCRHQYKKYQADVYRPDWRHSRIKPHVHWGKRVLGSLVT